MKNIFYKNHKERKESWIHIANETYETQRLRKSLEKKEAELLNKLKKAIRNESSRGGSFVFTKGSRKGFIDYMSIPAIKKLDLEPYRRESIEIWKLQRV